jgi:3-deoxy-D-manno-octulosonate 8-phosphate phosphatase (KDO 8-P phosphatase)
VPRATSAQFYSALLIATADAYDDGAEVEVTRKGDSKPQPLDRELAARIRLVVLDVDGVLTDASLLYGPRGESIKRFSARDGFAVKLLQSQGISVGILSGRMAPPLQARLRDLGIAPKLVIQGSRDKGRDIERLARRNGCTVAETTYMGDDLPDLPALARVGFAACPADAAPEVRARCQLVTSTTGGCGAVRELIETILRSRGSWDAIVDTWAKGGRPENFDTTDQDTAG